jgi:hypothetical protein
MEDKAMAKTETPTVRTPATAQHTPNMVDSSTWQTLGVTSDGMRTIMLNPGNNLPCCYDLDGMLVTPEVYEHNRQERIRKAAPALLAALEMVASLPGFERDEQYGMVVRAAIHAAKGE